MKKTFEPKKLAEEVRGAFGEASIDLDVQVLPSGIMGSPYDHVYVLPQGAEREDCGNYLIISDSREMGDTRDGYLLGLYEDDELVGTCALVGQMEQAVDWAREEALKVR